MSKVVTFTDELTDVICAPNMFDPRDMFCAQSLLRSFAESKLTFETDAYVAMIQVPAISCGVTSINNIKDPYTTVLRLCWLRILASDEDFEFSINRELENDWTLGLHELLPYIQNAVKEQYNNLVINTGTTSKCRKIVYSLKRPKKKNTSRNSDTDVPELYVTSSSFEGYCEKEMLNKTVVIDDILQNLRSELLLAAL